MLIHFNQIKVFQNVFPRIQSSLFVFFLELFYHNIDFVIYLFFSCVQLLHFICELYCGSSQYTLVVSFVRANYNSKHDKFQLIVLG